MSPFVITLENLVSRDGFGHPGPRQLFSISTLRLNLVLTQRVSPDFRGGVHLFMYTAIRRRVSPEFIGSRNCVAKAFGAESPPAQGQ